MVSPDTRRAWRLSTVAPNRAPTVMRRVRSLKSEYTSRLPSCRQMRASMSCVAAAIACSATVLPCQHTPHAWTDAECPSHGATAEVATCAYEATAAVRKAGLDSCRWRRHTGPSLTSSPLPASWLPGKKAVPSCTTFQLSAAGTTTDPMQWDVTSVAMHVATGYSQGCKQQRTFTKTEALSIITSFATTGSLTSTTYSPPSTSPTTPPYVALVCSRNASGSDSMLGAQSPAGPG